MIGSILASFRSDISSYPRRAWAATGIVVCWSVCYPMRVGGHGYSSLLVCLFVTRGAWAATGIVVAWFVCLFVIGFSTHLDATALRLQHG